MKKLKVFDPLTIAVLFIVVGFSFLLFYTLKGNRAGITTGFLATLGGFMLAIKATKEPGLLIENNFEGPAKYKPEGPCMAQDLKPTQTGVEVDGINTHIKQGYVFKVRSGTHVTIDGKGNIHTPSPVSRLVNKWVPLQEFAPGESRACWSSLF